MKFRWFSAVFKDLKAFKQLLTFSGHYVFNFHIFKEEQAEAAD
jgi:hypothetical protein